MLSKEECLFALESLKPMNINEFIEKGYLSFVEANSILKQLIKEHFDNPPTKCIATIKFDKDDLEKIIHDLIENPPLKFEELKPNTWVWDNNIKEYRKIDRVNKKYHGIEYFDTYGWFIEFEENRFYKYEVKEDE